MSRRRERKYNLEKAVAKREARLAQAAAMAERVYSLPPAERPYGVRGVYPKPPYYPKNADGLTPCRWCQKPQKKGWCSKECVADFFARSDWNTIASNIRKRDKVCRICGGQRARAGREWTIHAEYGYMHEGRACDLVYSWEVDHIKAVSEGGDDHPDNLRLLCGRCHLEITNAQATRWAAERRQARSALAGQQDLL